VDFLLAESTLTDEELIVLAWENILGGTDTTTMTTEWAMFELAKNPEIQACSPSVVSFFPDKEILLVVAIYLSMFS
jgi:hypothetical protein